MTSDTPRATTAVAATSPGGSALVAGLATVALAAGVSHALATAEEAAAASPTLTDPVLHLLRRATFGPTPALVAEVKKVGAKAWLDQQLKPSSIPDQAMDEFVSRFPNLRLKHWEVREKYGYGWEVMGDYARVHTARHLWSRRQLLEVVADFWTDHLVVPIPSGEVQAFAHTWQRDVIRRHALGTYRDMLAAAARHPAMLTILDNADSTKKAPNENYARELLELHTVGFGHYSEADVKQAARALTGLSFDNESLLYEFKPQRHHVGKVSLQGWSHANTVPEEGEKVALSLLAHLARHPRTAQRICRKLAIRFVSDSPSSTLVDALAKVYTANDTAIAPVLKALFTSKEFLGSAGKKMRRPYEDLVATMRVLGYGPDPKGYKSVDDLRWYSRQMGQVPMGWPAPNGYPDVAAAWSGSSSMLWRWNFHISAAGQWSFKSAKLPSFRGFLPATIPTTWGGYVRALADRLLIPDLTSAQRDAICTLFERAPGDTFKYWEDPVEPWRIGRAMALLLDSPNHVRR